MFSRVIILVMMFLCLSVQATQSLSQPFPPEGLSLPEYWGEKEVWWHGRVGFKGQVIASACTIAMEDTYQVIDLGKTPARDLQNSFYGLEKEFRVRLLNCAFTDTANNTDGNSYIHIIFDGPQGDSPEQFSLSGMAHGVDLQIFDGNGYAVRGGQVMNPLLINGDELHYSLRLVRNGEALDVGGYYAAIWFRIDYL